MKSLKKRPRFSLYWGKIFLLLSTLGTLTSCGDNRAAGAPPQKNLIFKDDFNRKDLGKNWRDTGGHYRIVDGELRAAGARNNPLWLLKKLPTNGLVEFTARSQSPAVDIKVEVYGDGTSKPTSISYQATSYVIILGGWNNTKSIIARMDEHKDDRKIRRNPKGVPNKNYKFSIERIGNRLSWFLDGSLFLEMNDRKPLKGPDHEYFAINNWQSEVFFDNIAIYEL